MDGMYERTAMCIGEDAVKKLQKSHVAVFGVGGVGGYTAEVLVRSGIGEITVIDNDVVSESNLNRQITALHSTIGKKKTEVIKSRLLDINPELKIHAYDMFFLPENSKEIDFRNFDFICDCVDTVTAKLEIIMRAKNENISIISSCGTGNKTHPEKLKITDIFSTKNCPLAKVMRKELKKRNIEKLDVIASDELINKAEKEIVRTPGSVAFVPSVAGIMIAGFVINNLIKQ